MRTVRRLCVISVSSRTTPTPNLAAKRSTVTRSPVRNVHRAGSAPTFFACAASTAGVRASHVSLFDGTNEGLAVEGKPFFSVQYHPEASPGPTDSHYLFDRFVEMIDKSKKGK